MSVFDVPTIPTPPRTRRVTTSADRLSSQARQDSHSGRSVNAVAMSRRRQVACSLMEVTACPACAGVPATRAGTTVPGFTGEAGDTCFIQPAYSVQRCAACALLYKTFTLTPDQLTDYYERTDFHKWETAGFHPPERLTLQILRTLHLGARILDFGCSSGRLLAPLVRSYECFGSEINAAAAHEAQRKGLSVLSADALAAGLPNWFDAVVVSDVFEHLLDPVTVLDRLTNRLRPGGLLIIVTGNGDSPACRLDPAQFWYFRNLEHVIMMTPGHAEWLAGRFGLRLCLWRDTCHYDFTYPARILQYAQHLAYWQFRNGPAAVKTLLRLVPRVRRAESWPMAPRFAASKDHVVAVFRKAPVTTDMPEPAVTARSQPHVYAIGLEGDRADGPSCGAYPRASI